ncbi:MAG: GDSL-type esterase/lipase family protein, partial [Flavobacteriales bacterium]
MLVCAAIGVSIFFTYSMHSTDQQAEIIPGVTSTKRVVLLGNSITEEWERIRPSFFQSHQINQATVQFTNRGVSGETTRQMKFRMDRDVFAEHPDVFVLLGGINDIAENEGYVPDSVIISNMEDIVLRAKELHAQVILCSILPAKAFPWRTNISPAERIVAVNQALQQVAER